MKVVSQVLGSMGAVLLASSVLAFVVFGTQANLVYFIIALGLALISFYFATNKGAVGKALGHRSSKLLAVSAATVVAALGLVAALNFIAYKSQKEYDLTHEGIYTLSDQTLKTLKNLKQEVVVKAFFRSDDRAYTLVREALERYKSQTALLKVEMIDPIQDHAAVEKYKIKENGPRIVFTAEKQNDVHIQDISEEALTNALIKLTSSNQTKIYFLTDHGELGIEDEQANGLSQIVKQLQNEGHVVESFSFIKATASKPLSGAVDLKSDAPVVNGAVDFPKDAKAVIILGVQTALNPSEVEAVKRYLQQGGKLFVGFDATKQNGLEALLDEWRIHVRNDFVIEEAGEMARLPPTVALIRSYENHPITQNFREPMAIPFARSLDVTETQATIGAQTKALFKSEASTFGETAFEGGTVNFDAGQDVRGPLTLAACATKEALPTAAGEKRSNEGRVVVVGGSKFISNRLSVIKSNANFFLNALNWLTGEESKISIRPKARTASRILLTPEQNLTVSFLSIYLLPVLLIALGVAIRQVRRNR